jgi:hypothetical protein
MISNSSIALDKANEMMNHYSQFLPHDYFHEEAPDS